MADMTDDEISTKRGRFKSTGYNGGLPFSHTMSELNSAPNSLGENLNINTNPHIYLVFGIHLIFD